MCGQLPQRHGGQLKSPGWKDSWMDGWVGGCLDCHHHCHLKAKNLCTIGHNSLRLGAVSGYSHLRTLQLLQF